MDRKETGLVGHEAGEGEGRAHRSLVNVVSLDFTLCRKATGAFPAEKCCDLCLFWKERSGCSAGSRQPEGPTAWVAIAAG